MKMHKILIVDDKEENLYLLKAMLQGNGYEVVSAIHGADALDIARKTSFDLIIADILMPVMDGFALCREWKKDERLKDIPFIFYTATYTDKRDQEFALSLGATRFIVKPEEPDSFMEIVRETLRQFETPSSEMPFSIPLEESEKDETVYLKNYNEALIRKLENKMEELERANRELKEDIEARRMTEAALRDSEILFRTLVESAPEAIFVHSEGSFVYLNPAMLRLIGASNHDDMLGKNFMERIAPNYHDAVREGIRVQSETGKPAPLMELEYLHLNGSMIPVETTAVPVRFQGRDAHLVFVRDVTGRKLAEEEKAKLEENLRQSQKLEAIGQLASGVAHDFNNCLTGISGYAEMIQMKLNEIHPDLASYAKKIVSSSMKAAVLTRQLLTFARKSRLNVIPMDTHDSIREVFSILSHTVNRLIKLNISLEATNSIINADRSQIENALLNLCVNARDAMPEGGVLTISTLNRSITSDCLTEIQAGVMPGDYVEISVSDTGTGISEGNIKRIFEPFFTTKEIGKGTGLGLASVYGTVKQHNGYIDLHSELGKGTKFKVLLPLIKDKEDELQASEERRITGEGKILVIDDDEAVRTSESGILSALGYTVIALEDGKKGVEWYEQNWKDIDLVIIDMIMPEISGLECFRRMKTINPDIRAIIASGYGKPSEKELMNAKGVAGFLAKPFLMNELSQVVSIVLGKIAKV